MARILYLEYYITWLKDTDDNPINLYVAYKLKVQSL